MKSAKRGAIVVSATDAERGASPDQRVRIQVERALRDLRDKKLRLSIPPTRQAR